MPEPSPVRVLVVAPLVDASFGRLAERHPVIDRRDGLGRVTVDGMTAEERAGVEVVVTSGIVGLGAAQMDLLPGLRLVHCFGVGFEGVDISAATARGIAVTNAPNTNAATVADHTLGLMLAAARGFGETGRGARAGQWNETRRRYRPTLNRARVGMLGLGVIGQQIARRVEAFEAEVAYTARSAKPNLPYRFVPDLLDLSRASDFLVVAAPGGADTRHLVNAAVLDALGPEGVLVNIGRGSIVDTAALVTALAEGRICGAGLDVIEEEPEVPPALAALDNAIITPHIAGRSPAALARQCDCALETFAALRSGADFPSRIA
ncbi:MAG: 2-hydroxyacid dehydrogenase [Pseudomonadota bacterium]